MAHPLAPVLPQALVLLDYFGIAVFAVSGALLAAEWVVTKPPGLYGMNDVLGL